jgi:hypothetical protein
MPPQANPATASDFDIGNGIIFENHPHAISDAAEEVVERETPSTPPQTPDQRPPSATPAARKASFDNARFTI